MGDSSCDRNLLVAYEVRGWCGGEDGKVSKFRKNRGGGIWEGGGDSNAVLDVTFERSIMSTLASPRIFFCRFKQPTYALLQSC